MTSILSLAWQGYTSPPLKLRSNKFIKVNMGFCMERLTVDHSTIFHQKYHSNKTAEAHIHGRNDGIDMCVRSHPHSNLTNVAQAHAALKSVKPKVKANVVEEPSVPVSAASTKDKGKGIMVEEPVKKLSKKKDLIRLDEEIASKLQVEFDEEERLAREKDEANVALTEEWEDIQAKVDVDYQLAQRLQAEEQE
ncbi:hypothetical protein Tco_1132090 [Tanacetum coccineum]|uniref:Uncharacterized protein n=1 Tax=Tanacetum coccineum TaxID=301880 RepID=A0ABQ5JBI6_9ASTR